MQTPMPDVISLLDPEQTVSVWMLSTFPSVSLCNEDVHFKSVISQILTVLSKEDSASHSIPF